MARVRAAHIGRELDGCWGTIMRMVHHEKADFVAVADPNPGKPEMARNIHRPDYRPPRSVATVMQIRNVRLPVSARLHQGYRQMLDEREPDAVTVLAPNNRHREIIEECARRGVHVFIWFPLAVNGRDARALCGVARRARIRLMIDYWTLRRREMQEVIRQARGGAVGRVQRIIAFSGHPGLPPDSCYGRYYHDPFLRGGGITPAQNPYGFSLILQLFFWPRSVYAVAKKLKDTVTCPTEDDSPVVLDYDGRRTISHGSASLPFFGKWVEGEIHAYGTGGVLIKTEDGGLKIRTAVTEEAHPECFHPLSW